MPVSCDAWFGRRAGILARRKELQTRTIVARRERYREMTGTVENAGARTPEVGPISRPPCATILTLDRRIHGPGLWYYLVKARA
jgi:hypothetical protein